MDLHNTETYTRRQFLTYGLTLASAATTVPHFISESAKGMLNTNLLLSSQPGVPQDHVLVIVQLGGGNDGLNTVVPFGNGDYYNARQGIAIPESQVLGLSRDQGIGLHPRLEGVKELYDDGMMTVIQGVGYPNPNRSHFKSMDIWHTGDTSGIGDGWLGRYFDNTCAGEPGGCSGHSGIAIGRSAPLAMSGRAYKPISFETEDLFKWTGHELHESLTEPYDSITGREPEHEDEDDGMETNESFLMRTAMDARVASEQIREAVRLNPLVSFPRNGLGEQLAMVSAMIRAGLDTRVYYVTLGGFDTHAGQGAAGGRHANLLGTWSEALRAFYNDLKAHRNDGRVLTLTFSEFGRRVGQNGSGGTDHGTAAPMFLTGPMVRSGIMGKHPSLRDLDNGDLKFHTDFRTIYAGVLEGWMGADSTEVLGRKFRPASVVKV